MTKLNRFQRVPKTEPSVRNKKIQEALEENQQHSQLSDRQIREMVSAGAHAILRLGYHRGVGHIEVSEAVTVSTYLTAVATSDDMLELYDDVLEGDESLKETLKVLSKRVADEIEKADRRRLKTEFEAEADAARAASERSP